MTKLGNSTLFGNTGSFVFAIYGLWLAHRRPSARQVVGAAAGGRRRGAADERAAMSSAQRNFAGDLLRSGRRAALRRLSRSSSSAARASLQPLPLLILVDRFSAPDPARDQPRPRRADLAARLDSAASSSRCPARSSGRDCWSMRSAPSRRWWSVSRLLTQPAISAADRLDRLWRDGLSPTDVVGARRDRRGAGAGPAARAGLASAGRASPVEPPWKRPSPLEQLAPAPRARRRRECGVRRLDRHGGRQRRGAARRRPGPGAARHAQDARRE